MHTLHTNPVKRYSTFDPKLLHSGSINPPELHPLLRIIVAQGMRVATFQISRTWMHVADAPPPQSRSSNPSPHATELLVTHAIKVDTPHPSIALLDITHAHPGYTRVTLQGCEAFLDERGELIQDEAILDRLEGLSIPAAWNDVWICAHEHGYIHSALIDAAPSGAPWEHMSERGSTPEQSMCQQERLMLDILEKL